MIDALSDENIIDEKTRVVSLGSIAELDQATTNNYSYKLSKGLQHEISRMLSRRKRIPTTHVVLGSVKQGGVGIEDITALLQFLENVSHTCLPSRIDMYGKCDL